MIHYQRKRRNPYRLPHTIYYQTLWTIKGYPYFTEQVDDIINSSPKHDGQPRAPGVSDPTYAKAVRLKDSAHVIRIIDEERNRIPKEYREGVWNNILYNRRFPDDAHRATYSRHKSKFIYQVAKRLKYI